MLSNGCHLLCAITKRTHIGLAFDSSTTGSEWWWPAVGRPATINRIHCRVSLVCSRVVCCLALVAASTLLSKELEEILLFPIYLRARTHTQAVEVLILARAIWRKRANDDSTCVEPEEEEEDEQRAERETGRFDINFSPKARLFTCLWWLDGGFHSTFALCCYSLAFACSLLVHETNEHNESERERRRRKKDEIINCCRFDVCLDAAAAAAAVKLANTQKALATNKQTKDKHTNQQTFT